MALQRLPCQMLGIIGSELSCGYPARLLALLGQCCAESNQWLTEWRSSGCPAWWYWVSAESNQWLTEWRSIGYPARCMALLGQSWIKPVTHKMALQWLPCQILGIIGSELSRGYPCRCLALLGQCWVVATLADAWHYWVSAESWLPLQMLGIIGSVLSRGYPARRLALLGQSWVQPVTYRMALQWLPCQILGIIGSVLLLLLHSPAISLGFTILGEILAYVTVFNPTMEVVTFRLRGWVSAESWLPCQMLGIIGSELNQISDLQNGTPVATLPDAWHYWVSAESWLPFQMLGIIGSELNQTSDLQNGTPVTTLPDAWHYWVRAESNQWRTEWRFSGYPAWCYWVSAESNQWLSEWHSNG